MEFSEELEGGEMAKKMGWEGPAHGVLKAGFLPAEKA